MKEKLAWPLVVLVILAALLVYHYFQSASHTQAVPESKPQVGEVRDINSTMVAQGTRASMTISPASNQTISGSVTIAVSGVPENTSQVWFGLVPMNQWNLNTKPNIGFDSNGADGWSVRFSASGLANGDYIIFAIPRDASQKDLGYVSANVTLKN
jgi:hypothetical protein